MCCKKCHLNPVKSRREIREEFYIALSKDPEVQKYLDGEMISEIDLEKLVKAIILTGNMGWVIPMFGWKTCPECGKSTDILYPSPCGHVCLLCAKKW